MGDHDFGDLLDHMWAGVTLLADLRPYSPLDELGCGLISRLPLVVVDGPGEGGDGDDQAGDGHRVEVLAGALTPGVQGDFDLGFQTGAITGGQFPGGGAGGGCG